MGKTILVFVVALVLGAALTWYLAPRVPEPTQPPTTPPMSAVPETRRAVVFVHSDADCVPETLPPTIFARVGDTVVWRIVAVPACDGYAEELELALKPDSPGASLFTGTLRGTTVEVPITKLPSGCDPIEVCSIDYSVTISGPDGSKTEDPKIDIWP